MRGSAWLPQSGPAVHSATRTQVPLVWSPGACPSGNASDRASTRPPGLGCRPRCHGNWIRTWWSRLDVTAASGNPTTRAVWGPGAVGLCDGVGAIAVPSGTARKRLR